MSTTLITGDAGADQFILLLDPVTGATDVFRNTSKTAAPWEVVTPDSSARLEINGQGGEDSVTVDFTSGDPIPGGLIIDAAASGVQPSLVVTGLISQTRLYNEAPAYTLDANGLTIDNGYAGTLAYDTITFPAGTPLNLFGDTDAAPVPESLDVIGGNYTSNQDLGLSGNAVDVTVGAIQRGRESLMATSKIRVPFDLSNSVWAPPTGIDIAGGGSTVNNTNGNPTFNFTIANNVPDGTYTVTVDMFVGATYVGAVDVTVTVEH